MIIIIIIIIIMYNVIFTTVVEEKESINFRVGSPHPIFPMRSSLCALRFWSTWNFSGT